MSITGSRPLGGSAEAVFARGALGDICCARTRRHPRAGSTCFANSALLRAVQRGRDSGAASNRGAFRGARAIEGPACGRARRDYPVYAATGVRWGGIFSLCSRWRTGWRRR